MGAGPLQGIQCRKSSAGPHPSSHARYPSGVEVFDEGLRSKSWDEFTRPDSPVFDFIFTVCDKAAGEACPVWPGHPATAHWGVTDPAAYVGPEEKQRAVFMKAYMELDTRIKLFLNLPLDSIDSMSLQQRLDDIGRS